jgi:DNA-directed RNA polymerase subunit RPC12/RpoP
MITPCSSCGYKLWSVERDVKGWLVQVYFDGEETSETYADQVTRCPRCGKWLEEPASIEAWHSR